MTTQNENLSNYIVTRERRGRIKRVIALVLLVLLLALITWSAMYYSANKRFAIPFITTVEAELEPPQYLYSISGPEGADALQQPIGVWVTQEDAVYVVDNYSSVVRCYGVEGDYRFSFGAVQSDEATSLVQPGRITESPQGELWVTDRMLRGIFIFDKTGKFLREFTPEGDAPEHWGPIAVSFGDDGLIYVVDVGLKNEHRILVYDESGAEVRRWGKTAMTQSMRDAPGDFYFPNGVAVAANGDLYVSDGNNRRLQIFTHDGAFKQIVATTGTPRGLAIDAQQRLYVVDALAHLVDIYKLDGTRIAGFGSAGVGLGQFRFPSDVAFDKRGRIFVTDRENHQVQVWGWPTGVIPPVVTPETPLQWVICLSPLLLFLIPLFRRKREFLVTEDFVDGMILAGKLSTMDDRRFRWIVPEADLPRYAGRKSEGIVLDDLLVGQAYSESDVVELIEKTGTDRATAILMAMADRIGRLATERADLRTPAETLGVEVVDRAAFLERYARTNSE